MVSFQPFAWLGSGHLGNTKTAAKEQEARKEKRVREQRGTRERMMRNRRAVEGLDVVQRQANCEKELFKGG